ncbi:superinfection immunity protein [Streptomyces sp. Ncost-T10-10d]|uniref:superinfection immunity protein n=1 Tax=Streptomyces sp. Ncost-T10-10d TaxID=1839774 RepID=UPI00081DBE5C|nr:superinfection immunity protein [Streptomyces sp. Ncost-T10-10d]SCF59773.1 Superinfection immunity protein [Streptomyces sp. Ncost-T10-10d]
MNTALTVVVVVICAALFLLPSLIAFNRSSRDRWLVLGINVVFGATVVGWAVALYLALRKPRVPAAA